MILWLVGVAFGLDLDEARDLAVEQAISVQVQQASRQRASGEALEALSTALPDLSAFVSLTAGAGFTSFGFARPPGESVGAGVTGRWVVIAPSQWAAAAAARHSLRGEEALIAWAQATARRDATIAYAEAVASVEVLQAWTAAEVDAKRAAEAVASLALAGLRPEADRARAAATAASVTANRVAAEGDVAGRCAALQSLLGLPIDGRCELSPVEWDDPDQGPPAHPSLVAAEEALAAAKAARSGTLLERAPSLTATGTATQWAVTPAEPGPGWSAEVRLDVPLISSGAGIARARQAAAAQDEAALALEATRRELEVAGISALAVWQSAQAAVVAREEAAQASEEALELVDARYREGLDDLEAWISARRDRDEARVALALSRAQLGAAVAQLEAVRGVTR